MTTNTATERPGLTVTFMLLSVLFTTCLIVSNLIEIKTVDIGWMTITAGVIVFPISYIINDCVVEIYGFRKARLMIWTGFAMSLITTLLLQLALVLPGGSDWTQQTAMEAIYGSVPRIVVASFAAFVCGSMVNARVMSKMKVAAAERACTDTPKAGARDKVNSLRSFSARAIASTLLGESVDSMIFFPVAFGGVFSWDTIVNLIITQAILKTAYEVAILPVTISIVRILKRREQLDTIDREVRYTWL